VGFVYSAHNVLGTGRESKLLEGARGGGGGGGGGGGTREEFERRDLGGISGADGVHVGVVC